MGGVRGANADDMQSGESDTEVDDFIVDDQGRPVKSEERSHGHANRYIRSAISASKASLSKPSRYTIS